MATSKTAVYPRADEYRIRRKRKLMQVDQQTIETMRTTLNDIPRQTPDSRKMVRAIDALLVRLRIQLAVDLFIREYEEESGGLQPDWRAVDEARTLALATVIRPTRE